MYEQSCQKSNLYIIRVGFIIQQFHLSQSNVFDSNKWTANSYQPYRRMPNVSTVHPCDVLFCYMGVYKSTDMLLKCFYN